MKKFVSILMVLLLLVFSVFPAYAEFDFSVFEDNPMYEVDEDIISLKSRIIMPLESDVFIPLESDVLVIDFGAWMVDDTSTFLIVPTLLSETKQDYNQIVFSANGWEHCFSFGETIYEETTIEEKNYYMQHKGIFLTNDSTEVIPDLFLSSEDITIQFIGPNMEKKFIVSSSELLPLEQFYSDFFKAGGKKQNTTVSIKLATDITYSRNLIGSFDASKTNIDTITPDTPHIPIPIRRSTDKYTWYIKDYLGMNAASVGYTSWGGDRMDAYGESHVKIVFLSSDGTYVDIDDKKALQNYVVATQNTPPNTPVLLTFMTDSDGNEYDNLVQSQSIDEIVLGVKKVDSSETAPTLTQITPSPDKYTWYIKDYVGRNANYVGYTSWGGDRMDTYGEAHVEIRFISNNGSYVDIENEDELKKYTVTKQNVRPNTKLKLTFLKDSDGEEYDNLIDYQSIEEINLYVKKN